MRILVISDIHANLVALETVLNDAPDYDAVWCLGDLVGYGPHPNECIERVRRLPNLICLIGNHDAAVVDQMDVSTFNPEARISIVWTKSQISADNLGYLFNLPNRVVTTDVTLVHGSPRSPTFEYLLDTYLATLNFGYFETPYCFVGHTHLPVHYLLDNGQDRAQLLIPQVRQILLLDARSILNPGSVGQPRDRDPRASYAIFDSEANTWELRRIAYDIASVQEQMRDIGLPERHIQRLAAGW